MYNNLCSLSFYDVPVFDNKSIFDLKKHPMGIRRGVFVKLDKAMYSCECFVMCLYLLLRRVYLNNEIKGVRFRATVYGGKQRLYIYVYVLDSYTHQCCNALQLIETGHYILV